MGISDWGRYWNRKIDCRDNGYPDSTQKAKAQPLSEIILIFNIHMNTIIVLLSSTTEILESSELLGDGIRVGDGGPHQHIRVTRDEFGHTVNYNIGAQLQRVLQVGTHKSAVHR